MQKILGAIIVGVVLCFAQVASAGPFEDGVAAFKRGDYAIALREFRPLAEQGDAGAQFYLGGMYEFGLGVARDDAEAVKWYLLADAQGNADTRFNLGIKFAGRYDAEAMKWYRLAAARGDAKAQNELGFRYQLGLGVAQDGAEAVKWYRLAAAQGVAYAQSALGFMLEKGEGVARDDAESVKWQRLAAEQGSVWSQINLGNKYGEGRGVAQDYKEAMKWYRMAAEQGDADAQFILGKMYLEGKVVAQDKVRAHMWSNLANVAAGVEGNWYAFLNRSLAELGMTPEQIAQAEEMARKCQASNYKQCD